MEIKQFEEQFSIDILYDLFLSDNKQVIFYLKDEQSFYEDSIFIIHGKMQSVGLAEKVKSIEELLEYLDSKSQICEVRGVEVFLNSIRQELFSNKKHMFFEMPIDSNSNKWISVTLNKLVDKNIILGIIKDISSHQINTERLFQESYKDNLTGLFNSTTCNIHMSTLQDDCERYIGFIDLDGFKEINDQYGHSVGDEVLKVFGKVLMQLCDNNIIAYRKSGDEFAFQTKGLGFEQVLKFVESINQRFQKANFIKSHLSCSIGFVKYDKQVFTSPLDTLKLADIAMYQSKETGNGKATYLSIDQCSELLNNGNIDNILNYYGKNRIENRGKKDKIRVIKPL